MKIKKTFFQSLHAFWYTDVLALFLVFDFHNVKPHLFPVHNPSIHQPKTRIFFDSQLGVGFLFFFNCLQEDLPVYLLSTGIFLLVAHFSMPALLPHDDSSASSASSPRTYIAVATYILLLKVSTLEQYRKALNRSGSRSPFLVFAS